MQWAFTEIGQGKNTGRKKATNEANHTDDKENYDKIKIGMSYWEVLGVLGKPDTCEDPVLKTKNCMWGSSDKQIKIKFVGDTVAWRSSKGL